MAAADVERPRRRFRWSTRWTGKATWVGSLAVVLALGIAALTSVTAEHVIGDADEELRGRLAIYGAVLPGSLATAVDRDDRDAARQALDALAVDRDLTAVILHGADGRELYRRGAPLAAPSGWQTGAVDAAELLESNERIVATIPVPTSVPGSVASAGRRGALMIELSTAHAGGHHKVAMWTAIAAGTAALVFGVVARRLIARSVVRRLHAIVDAESEAEPVASPPSTPGAAPPPATAQPPATAPPATAAPPGTGDSQHDEIAIFGEAFHQTLTRLRRDQIRLRTAVSELTTVKDELARTNRELEQRVALRTGELSDANRQLQVEMTQRSHMEVELRQAQKLESVGRLASGIAHEINTPVQFVSDSCSFLENASADLIAVITAYRGALADLDRKATTPPQASERMRAVEAERDLGYLIEQIPLAITRALNGLGRVSAIVHAMKEFAYPDRKEQAPADLNRAILSTLTVARNEYKYVAEVKTELDDLPLVTCHIGELNQVILNMVVNSAHAIAEGKAERERDGVITVRTRARGTHVAIEIQDNGCGIPPAAFDKIFDPFFTTKEIGKGTGQGLAIARAVVVDKHAGKIDVDSRVGYGTTFIITLPILGRDDDVAMAAPSPSESLAISDDSIDRGLGPPSGHDLESA